MKASDLLDQLNAKEEADRAQSEAFKQAQINVLSKMKAYDPSESIESNISAYLDAKTAEIRASMNEWFDMEMAELTKPKDTPNYDNHRHGAVRRIL